MPKKKPSPYTNQNGLNVFAGRYHGEGCINCVRWLKKCKALKSKEAFSNYCHTGDGFERLNNENV